MTTIDLLLQLKYRFRDYFIPVEGKTASLVGLEDMITEFIEDKYIMKIDFKMNKEKIIAVNNILSVYDQFQIEFSYASSCKRVKLSMRKELRNIFVRKTIVCPEKKSFKMSLPYYLAHEFYEALLEYCIGNTSSYLNGLDQLKNELHKKLL